MGTLLQLDIFDSEFIPFKVDKDLSEDDDFNLDDGTVPADELSLAQEMLHANDITLNVDPIVELDGLTLDELNPVDEVNPDQGILDRDELRTIVNVEVWDRRIEIDLIIWIAHTYDSKYFTPSNSIYIPIPRDRTIRTVSFLNDFPAASFGVDFSYNVSSRRKIWVIFTFISDWFETGGVDDVDERECDRKGHR